MLVAVVHLPFTQTGAGQRVQAAGPAHPQHAAELRSEQKHAGFVGTGVGHVYWRWRGQSSCLHDSPCRWLVGTGCRTGWRRGARCRTAFPDPASQLGTEAFQKNLDSLATVGSSPRTRRRFRPEEERIVGDTETTSPRWPVWCAAIRCITFTYSDGDNKVAQVPQAHIGLGVVTLLGQAGPQSSRSLRRHSQDGDGLDAGHVKRRGGRHGHEVSGVVVVAAGQLQLFTHRQLQENRR